MRKETNSAGETLPPNVRPFDRSTAQAATTLRERREAGALDSSLAVTRHVSLKGSSNA